MDGPGAGRFWEAREHGMEVHRSRMIDRECRLNFDASHTRMSVCCQSLRDKGDTVPPHSLDNGNNVRPRNKAKVLSRYLMLRHAAYRCGKWVGRAR